MTNLKKSVICLSVGGVYALLAILFFLVTENGLHQTSDIIHNIIDIAFYFGFFSPPLVFVSNIIGSAFAIIGLRNKSEKMIALWAVLFLNITSSLFYLLLTLEITFDMYF